MQLNVFLNVLSFVSTVETCIYIADSARVVSNGCSFVAMTDGIVLEDGCDFRGNSLSVFNAQQDGLRINDIGSGTAATLQAASIEDSTRYDLNILSSTAQISGSGRSSIDKLNFVSGSEMYGAIIDLKEGDEGFNVMGELHVGLAEQGYDVIALIRRIPPNSRSWLSYMADIVIGDIRDKSTLEKIVNMSPDSVIHTISLDHKASQDKDFEEVLHINVPVLVLTYLINSTYTKTSNFYRLL